MMRKEVLFISFIGVCLLSLIILAPVMAKMESSQGHLEFPSVLAKSTPTPKPSSTPTSAPILFDDFKGKSYDEAYNPKIWEPDIDDEVCKIEKSNDGIFFALAASAKETDCKLISIDYSLLKDFSHIESRMKLTKGKGEKWGGIGVNLVSEDRDWIMTCHIGKYKNDPPYLNCWTPLWDTPPNPGGVGGSFNRWRTFRMDIDQDTMTFKFYFDNLFYSKYTPPDAEKLKNDHFRVEIGLYSEDGVMAEGYVGHVKVWP